MKEFLTESARNPRAQECSVVAHGTGGRVVLKGFQQ